MDIQHNKIYHRDCLEGMKDLPDNCVDLVVTSPPYNLRNSSGGGMRNGSGGLWEKAKLLKGYDGEYQDDLPRNEYISWQRQCLKEMLRVVRPTGAIFYNHKWRVQDWLLEDQHEIVSGSPVRQIIIWQRSGGINFNLGYFLPTYEVIYLICHKEFRLASRDPEHPKAVCAVGDVWYIPQDLKNKHPAPFPLEVPLRCIEATDAQLILDPFMGSGTTALAAEILNRNWIGFDISSKYIDQAEERLTKFRTCPSSEINTQRNLIQRIHKLERELTAAKEALEKHARPNIFDLVEEAGSI